MYSVFQNKFWTSVFDGKYRASWLKVQLYCVTGIFPWKSHELFLAQHFMSPLWTTKEKLGTVQKARHRPCNFTIWDFDCNTLNMQGILISKNLSIYQFRKYFYRFAPYCYSNIIWKQYLFTICYISWWQVMVDWTFEQFEKHLSTLMMNATWKKIKKFT